MQTETHDHLLQALSGEAFAFARYMLYAEAARRHGRPELADLFARAARTERFEHFAEEAELAGLVGTDEDNLRAAIAGERYEVESLYPSFAQQARLAGEAAAAERFTEIRADESEHLAAFARALEQLEQGAQDIRHEPSGAAG